MITFEDIEGIYKQRVNFLKRMLNNKESTYDGRQIQLLYDECQTWFTTLKYYCDDFPRYDRLTEPTTQEKELYCGAAEENGVLTFSGIYEYRGVRAGVYLDDYGQQYVVKVIRNGKTYERSCGAYNFFFELEASTLLDEIADDLIEPIYY